MAEKRKGVVHMVELAETEDETMDAPRLRPTGVSR